MLFEFDKGSIAVVASKFRGILLTIAHAIDSFGNTGEIKRSNQDKARCEPSPDGKEAL